MWYGSNPELERQFQHIRQMVKLSHQSPTKEWPLVFDRESDSLLVVREWPGGELTAYTVSKNQNGIPEEG